MPKQTTPQQIRTMSRPAKLLIIILAIAYILWPIDISTFWGCPDAVPILGWIDDLVVAYFAYQKVFRS